MFFFHKKNKENQNDDYSPGNIPWRNLAGMGFLWVLITLSYFVTEF